MILTAPATNFLGNDLLKSGAILSEKNIVTLKSWGVKSVSVQGDAGEIAPSGERDHMSSDLILEKLERMFSTVKDQPVMQLIYDIARKQATKCESRS